MGEVKRFGEIMERGYLAEQKRSRINFTDHSLEAEEDEDVHTAVPNRTQREDDKEAEILLRCWGDSTNS